MKVIGNLTKDAIIRAAVSEGLSVTQALGTPVTFHADTTYANKVVYDSNAGKVVIIYTDGGNSNYPTAVVGTVNASNNSISFGSATVIETTGADTNRIGVGFDSSNNKIVVAYRDTSNSDKGRAAVGTVSGTSISFGTPVDFQASLVSQLTATFDSNENRFVIGYRDSSNSNYGTAIVGTVSGTSISFGTKVVFNSGNTTNLDTCVFDSSNNKVIFAYRDQGASQQITAVVGTVSGTSISFGSEVVVSSNSGTYPALAFDSVNNKVALAWNDQPTTNVAKCAIGTVSGTSISFGTAVEFDEISAYFSGAFDANAGKVVFVYQDIGNGSKPTIASGTISGTSITFDTPVAIEDTQMNVISGCAYDSGNKKIVASYMDDGNSDHGDAVVFQASYSSATGGTIADGKPVIVNANGTVSSVSQSGASLGTATTYAATDIGDQESTPSVVYDTNSDRIVVFYADEDNSFYGTALVGTVSSGSISFGTAVVFESSKAQWISAAFDSSNNKIVVAYTEYDDSRAGNCVVGTVDPSDNSISFGSEAEFAADARRKRIAFDSSNNKVLIVYKDGSQHGNAIVGTVSGTSISYGSNNNWQSAQTNEPGVVFDSSNNRFLVTYVDAGNSDKGAARVATISSTSVSLGSETFFNDASTQYILPTFDSTNNKVIITFKDNGDSNKGKGIIGTISGTSVSFGSEAEFTTNAQSYVTPQYDSVNNKFSVSYRDDGDSSIGKVAVGTVSGTSISFESPITFKGGTEIKNIATGFDPDTGQTFIFYSDSLNGDRGEYISLNTVTNNLTAGSFVGFMKGAALDGTNGEILSSCSIARNQTSLTPGQTYFVSPTDGALSTTAGSPSVTAGTAISSTELIVKG